MFQVHCLDPISTTGSGEFGNDFLLTENIMEAHGILVRSTSMHTNTFSKNLLAIARAGAGVNNIPLEKCTRQGIVVFNTPGANANAVTELVLAGLFLSCRDILGGIQWVTVHKALPDIAQQTEREKKAFAGIELKGKTLGVIGLGAVGTKTANAAKALGMRVLGFDPYISDWHAQHLDAGIQQVNDIHAIYNCCDFITLHVPSNEQTKKMVGKEALLQMKPNTVLLNFARADICDEAAVLETLTQRRLRKYVTDFPNTITAGQKHCIVLPHLGASTREAKEQCAVMAVQELKEYLENGNILHSVNFPNCHMGRCKTTCRITILHKNTSNIRANLTDCIENAGIHIEEFMNNSDTETAYTMIDTKTPVPKPVLHQLEQTDGVMRVRILTPQ